MKAYGVYEVSKRAGVAPCTVSTWAKEGRMPKPDFSLRCGPVWLARTLAAWFRKLNAENG